MSKFYKKIARQLLRIKRKKFRVNLCNLWTEKGDSK